MRAAIHPAIGIARVGNSEKGFFIGPEVTDPAAGQAWVRQGFLRRRSSDRQPVFASTVTTPPDEAVVELTADNADIEWTVQVANKKAAWYQFQIAIDIPEADPRHRRQTCAMLSRARSVQAGDHAPRPGRSQGRRNQAVSTGLTTGVSRHAVYLGEIRTDEKGRLIFLGGHGVSASAAGNTRHGFRQQRRLA